MIVVNSEERPMKIAMIFPGYGSQFVGMGKELYDEYRLVQEYFEQASSCLDINFVKLCFASSDAELSLMRNAYTSIFLVSSSIVALLKELDIRPDIVAGFNQGEYAALFASDGISLPDGLYLLSKFSTFYEEALQADDKNKIVIAVKGVDAKTLEDICFKATMNEDKVYIALYETANQHVVAGDEQAVERVRDMVSALSDKQEIDIEHADVAVGLHSDWMNSVVNQLEIYLNKVDFHDLAMPFIEFVRGNLIIQGKKVHDQILNSINSPVVWPRVMKKLADYDCIVEIGPGKKLSKWLRALYPNKQIVTINKPADIKQLQLLMQPTADKAKDETVEE